MNTVLRVAGRGKTVDSEVGRVSKAQRDSFMGDRAGTKLPCKLKVVYGEIKTVFA